MKRFMAAVLAAVAVAAGASTVRANDAQIAQQIVGQLRQQQVAANLKGFNIGVQVDQGTVTMLGQVASQDQATLALEIARRIPGVRLVINDLQVRSPAVTMTSAAAPMPQPIATGQYRGESPMAAQYAGSPAAYNRPAGYGPPAYAPQPIGSGAVPAPQPRSILRTQPVAYAPATSHRTRPAAAMQAQGGYVDGGDMMVGSTPVAMNQGYGGTYDSPQMPGYAWPSYASHPNYAAVSYPQQYSAAAWPYIGPFYPYPQVPLGWRKVMLEWDDGWWFLDFKSK